MVSPKKQPYNNAQEKTRKQRFTQPMVTLISLTFCHWSLARKYNCTISIFNQPTLNTMKVNKTYERKYSYTKTKLNKKHQEVDDILPKSFRDADYADDPALLANTSAQYESLLHSLKQQQVVFVFSEF